MKIRTKACMLLTSLCMISTSFIYGQTTIPNGSFETWDNVGSNTEEPTNWSSNETGGGVANLGPQTCFRDNNPHTGNYSLRLANGNVFGTGVNATATTGKIEAPSLTPSTGYINTVTADPNFNSTFTGRPDSLVGWFRFTQGGTDVGRIQAVLHDNFDVSIPDQGGSASHIIAEAVFDVPNGTTPVWTRFAVPFTYNNGSTPTHILLIATASSVVGSASTSTIMWLDDLEAIYCTPATTTLTETACASYTSPSGNTWTTTGTYQDTIIGAAGSCDSIYTINLTVNNADTSVTVNGTTLTANATGAVYQWLDCANGNAPIAGATNASYTPATGVGSFAVQVTENGCTATSPCYNLVLSSVEQLDFANTLALFPNPTTGQFSLDLGASYENLSITINDIHGKMVYQTTSQQEQLIELNLDQPAGVYFVAITSEKKRAVVKLIKQ